MLYKLWLVLLIAVMVQVLAASQNLNSTTGNSFSTNDFTASASVESFSKNDPTEFTKPSVFAPVEKPVENPDISDSEQKKVKPVDKPTAIEIFLLTLFKIRKVWSNFFSKIVNTFESKDRGLLAKKALRDSMKHLLDASTSLYIHWIDPDSDVKVDPEFSILRKVLIKYLQKIFTYFNNPALEEGLSMWVKANKNENSRLAVGVDCPESMEELSFCWIYDILDSINDYVNNPIPVNIILQYLEEYFPVKD